MTTVTQKPEDLLKARLKIQEQRLAAAERESTRTDTLQSQIQGIKTPTTGAGIAKGVLAFAAAKDGKNKRQRVEEILQEREAGIAEYEKYAAELKKIEDSIPGVAASAVPLYQQFNKDGDKINLLNQLNELGRGLNPDTKIDFVNDSPTDLLITTPYNTKRISIEKIAENLPEKMRSDLVTAARGHNSRLADAERRAEVLRQTRPDLAEDQIQAIAGSGAAGITPTATTDELTNATKTTQQGQRMAVASLRTQIEDIRKGIEQDPNFNRFVRLQKSLLDKVEGIGEFGKGTSIPIVSMVARFTGDLGDSLKGMTLTDEAIEGSGPGVNVAVERLTTDLAVMQSQGRLLKDQYKAASEIAKQISSANTKEEKLKMLESLYKWTDSVIDSQAEAVAPTTRTIRYDSQGNRIQ